MDKKRRVGYEPPDVEEALSQMERQKTQEVYGRIHSIETFGTVDGPGIRYVLFLQGCPMRCLYCHNPDTWNLKGGTRMSSREILDDYEKYKPFLKGGGLTLTGGEPLLQMDFVLDLFSKAKERGIHTCVDTSGITFTRTEANLRKFDRLLELTDLFLLDIKQIDTKGHEELTGFGNERVLDFALYLNEKKKDVWIRHVVVPTITDEESKLYSLGRFLGGLTNIKGLDVLPYHTMGKQKYKEMGIAYPLEDLEDLPKETAIWARGIILRGMKQKRKELRSK